MARTRGSVAGAFGRQHETLFDGITADRSKTSPPTIAAAQTRAPRPTTPKEDPTVAFRRRQAAAAAQDYWVSGLVEGKLARTIAYAVLREFPTVVVPSGTNRAQAALQVALAKLGKTMADYDKSEALQTGYKVVTCALVEAYQALTSQAVPSQSTAG